ncbi:4-alpha-glucanotransferase [Limibaculum sp. M0105]|uniref:4-alpha-glucanotransferase n=1 Tax=Thermohalobaculum xanthum TaxID=2753746 RepID=A0A8J7M429_9RHOB|nr:4-alpha-glucanotransferase [Thermohalobaculum xanthum]MBK0397838.1 4-alpha-glucanotransferase [Thermohalobaculum xanthum]
MTPEPLPDPILDLAGLAGILPAWVDLSGHVHTTTRETAVALLSAMGLIRAAGDAAEAAAAMRAARAARHLPRAHVARAWRPSDLSLPRGAIEWRLTFETGGIAEGRSAGVLELPALPPGLHELAVGDERCLVIASPAEAPSVADLCGRTRIWGFTGAVHALHSTRNPVGPGDYADLGAAAAALAPLGADFLGINPLHALGAAYPGYSPYSPGHRGFLDTRAIAPDRIPGFEHDSTAQALIAARHGPAANGLIDHEAARAWRDAALRALHRAFADDARAEARAAHDAFRAARGRALADFVLFEALSLRHGGDWRNWPAGIESPEAPGARAFARENPTELDFHAWLQWVADSQLGAAQDAARAAGMALGIYADLAVGVRPDGAEVWARPGVFAMGVSLGAPPDQFSPDGQAWGLAPFSPEGLAAAGYRPFIETIRAVMRHAGLVRIDHILGFDRTFWVPRNGAPGSYVRMPRDVLMAIVRLEAVRASAVVIGEDLGVVPEGLRERMAESHLHGSAVMQFERDFAGDFRPPADYPARAAASVGTHDTPTIAGWWEARDIDWAERLGRTTAEDAARWRGARTEDRRRLLHLLAREGLLPEGIDPASPPDGPLPPALNAAIHRALARAPSAILAVQIDDVLGTVEQANIPGTVDAHPNWRRPVARPVEALAGDPVLAAVARAVASERPR